MSPKLSPETQRRVDMMYPPEQQEEVTALLHGLEAWGDLERMQFAALKVSNGDIEVLKKAIDAGNSDFRDLLSAAGFHWSTTKHERWLPKGIGPQQEGWWTRRRKRSFGF